MSDKHRPYWDMEFLISLGYRRVFAEPRIDELVRDEKAKNFISCFRNFLWAELNNIDSKEMGRRKY